MPIALAAMLSTAASAANAREVVLAVSDSNGVAERRAVPVSQTVDLSGLAGGPVVPELLRLTEANTGVAVPVQFEADRPASRQGTLWFLLPPSATRERRLKLTLTTNRAPAAFTIKADPAGSFFDIAEGPLPVLRYNHGTVPVPAGVDTNYARGDYLMPLFGPDGEVLTDDYPKDHPHHRGVGWSWPVTRWGNEVRDIWACQGVWARPVAMRRVEAGSVCALLHAESVWKWGDTNPIVREEVVIRAFRKTGDDRFVDVEVRLTALAEGVAIGGRPHGGYGGFGLRAMPAQQRVITRHTDPAEVNPRRSWLDYSGRFAGGKGPAGLAILEHVANPIYPNALLEYPDLNYVMPAFPGEREVPLSKATPLVLRHRLWVHAGMAGEPALADVWAAYANPPQTRVESR